MSASSQAPLHVVVAGGGIAGVETVLALGDLAGGMVRMTLVAPDAEFELKPLRTAVPFAADHMRRHPLRELTRNLPVELRQDAVAAVEPDRHVVRLASGGELHYDALVLAVGARPRPAYQRALTFGASPRTEALNGLLADLDEHYSHSVAFIVAPGVSWPLPLYELALMTAAEVWSMGIDDVQLELITPESSPLAIFGPAASSAVAKLLDDAGVAFRPGAYADVDAQGRITVRPGGHEVEARRVVALPLLDGPRVPGVPADANGFMPIDDHGRVRGLDDVYAAGDGADFPVKQGGLGCQQADAIAEQLAARAGADLEPTPFRPVLRGKLLTGGGAQYLRNPLHGGAGESRASDFQLWSPATKVSGRYLSLWLNHLDAGGTGGLAPAPAAPPHVDDVDIEVPLPAPYELRRRTLAFDPYSPVRHPVSRA
jgi:sulfide:quinone oxidoreductase